MNEFPYVFLSYATADRERALQIADALELAGVHVWIDRRGLSAGDLWAAEITAAIRSCAAVALVCTAASVTSRNVRQEIQLAWNHERPLIPLMLEQVAFPDELAYFLEGRQWVDIEGSSNDTWTRQIAALIEPGHSLPEVNPPVQTSRRETNLPVPASPILGREAIIEQVSTMLEQPGTQLVTLVGPGGVGKTRLALAIAEKYQESFPGSIQFVDLAQIRDAALVLPAVAGHLGIRGSSNQSIVADLQAGLRDEPLLLVLDNWEQVLGAAADVGRLIASLPKLLVLATSREPLRLRAEHIVEVHPLEIGASETRLSVDELASSPAINLYVTRAAMTRPGFALTEENSDAIAEICRRLDGLPLAIELAASRSALLSPGQMLQRLERRLPVLTGGARDLPERQQTLRDAIAWSDELLTEEERAVLRRLSVFAGGFTMESAIAVTDIPGNLDAAVDVFQAMERLVGHSLLRMTTVEGFDRFQMLETIREYGYEKLEAAGELREAQERHAAWFLNLAETSSVNLTGPEQGHWLSRLRADQDNLRAALGWLVLEQPVIALKMSAALLQFWFATSLAEADLWYQRVLDAGRNSDPHEYAKAAVASARFAYVQGDTERSSRLANEALAIFDQRGDDSGKAQAMSALGICANLNGNFAEAERLLTEGLALARRADDHQTASVISHNLPLIYMERNPERALELFIDAVEVTRQLDDRLGLTIALNNLVEMQVNLERYDDALSSAQEILALRREHKSNLGMELLLTTATVILLEKGEWPVATRIAAAAEVAKQSSNLFEIGGVNDYEAKIDRLREELGDFEFELQWNTGKTLTIDRALDELQDAIDALSAEYAT